MIARNPKNHNDQWLVAEEYFNDNLELHVESEYVEDPEAVTFGIAIKALKSGKRIARKGWNGKGMFIYYVPANTYEANSLHAANYFGNKVPYRAYMALVTAQDDVAAWSPSGSDALAEDWEILPD